MTSQLPPGAGIDLIEDLPVYSPPLHDDTRNRRLVSASDGAGVEVIQGELAARGGADAHYHKTEWQIIILQSGQARIRLGAGAFQEIGPGTVIRIPPGVAHAFEVQGPEPAQVYVIYSPPLGPDGFHKA